MEKTMTNLVSSLLTTEEYTMLQDLIKYGPRLKNGRTSVSGTIRWLIREAHKILQAASKEVKEGRVRITIEV